MGWRRVARPSQFSISRHVTEHCRLFIVHPAPCTLDVVLQGSGWGEPWICKVIFPLASALTLMNAALDSHRPLYNHSLSLVGGGLMYCPQPLEDLYLHLHSIFVISGMESEVNAMWTATTSRGTPNRRPFTLWPPADLWLTVEVRIVTSPLPPALHTLALMTLPLKHSSAHSGAYLKGLPWERHDAASPLVIGPLLVEAISFLGVAWKPAAPTGSVAIKFDLGNTALTPTPFCSPLVKWWNEQGNQSV